MQKELENQIESLLNSSFLKPFLTRENITDISYNGSIMMIQDNIQGRYKANYQPTQEEVLQLGKKIADLQGKEFTNTDPILDTELSYYRVNFIHPSVSPFGCTFAIRVSRPRLAIENVSKLANPEVAELLNVLIKANTNIIIAGKTGAGKTELQKALVDFIPDDKKILLIEDTMDSHLKELYPKKDIISWRTITDGSREHKVTYNDLIKAGLRNNPDWIIIAETRGSEAYDMLESALTDHSIITTIHAKQAASIPSRLIKMIGQKYQTNEFLLGKDIVETLRFGIYMTLESTNNGFRRYIREIVEFTDFTEEKGLESIPVYKVKKIYDKETNKYKKTIVTNPISNETRSELTYKGLIHMVPDCFLGMN